MRRYLLDTGIAGHFVYRRKGVFERAERKSKRGDHIGICVPVLGELYFGVEYSDSRERNLRPLLAAISTLRIWPFTEEAAAEYGKIAAFLERSGRPIQQVDMQIAAIAITLGPCTVVTTDSDLSAVPGLKVENWAA
jgi:tRNA(fMet)-specific endonuclease VapC